MKDFFFKAILFLVAIAAVWAADTFEMRMYVSSGYASNVADPQRVGSTVIYCEAYTIFIRVNCVSPPVPEISLRMKHNGSWTDIGPIFPDQYGQYKKELNIRGLCGRFRFRASKSGSRPELVEQEVYVDCSNPRCSGCKFLNAKNKNPGHGKWVQSPAYAHFEPVSDDAPWKTWEYRISHDELPLNVQWLSSLTNNIPVTLSEGFHKYSWDVNCGCGHFSGWQRDLDVFVDNTAPVVFIGKPAADAGIRLSPLEVEISASDQLSGIFSVKLYVDRVDATPEAEFRGPWMKNMMNKKSAKVSIRESGMHQLIIVAEDQAGNTAQATRSVNVTSTTVTRPK